MLGLVLADIEADVTTTLGPGKHQHIAKAGKTVAAGHAKATVKIELLQPTGSRLHVTFPFGGASAVAELEAHDASAPCEKLTLDIDMTRAIVIDPTSGRVF